MAGPTTPSAITVNGRKCRLVELPEPRDWNGDGENDLACLTTYTVKDGGEKTVAIPVLKVPTELGTFRPFTKPTPCRKPGGPHPDDGEQLSAYAFVDDDLPFATRHGVFRVGDEVVVHHAGRELFGIIEGFQVAIKRTDNDHLHFLHPGVKVILSGLVGASNPEITCDLLMPPDTITQPPIQSKKRR